MWGQLIKDNPACIEQTDDAYESEGKWISLDDIATA